MSAGLPHLAPIVALALATTSAASSTDAGHPDLRLFFEAAGLEEEPARAALAAIAESWRDDYAAMIVDIARLMRPRRRARSTGSTGGGGDAGGFDDSRGGAGAGAPGAARGGSFPTSGPRAPEHPTTRVRERLLRFLSKQTGEDFGDDLRKWRRWYWNRPYHPHPDYTVFKATLYGQVDERLAEFFPPGGKELIRSKVGVDGSAQRVACESGRGASYRGPPGANLR